MTFSKRLWFLALSVFTIQAYASSPVKVVTSTTDLAWAVKEIGGAHVEVQSLLKGTENPHFVDAIPEFIRLVSEAQAVVIVGLDLEIGWMPKVLTRSGNAQVQPGGKGYCEAGRAVHVLEKPTGDVDRSMGDVHPSGNPHFWLSPKAFAQAAGPIAQTLIAVDPAHTADYQVGARRFTELMEEIRKKNAAKLHSLIASISGPVLMEYHKEFAYFLETYGLRSFGSVEEKPGVAPSAGRLAEVALAAKGAGVRFVLAGETAPKKTLEKFTELSAMPVAVVPMSVQPHAKVKDYPAFQEYLVDTVAKQLGSRTL